MDFSRRPAFGGKWAMLEESHLVQAQIWGKISVNCKRPKNDLRVWGEGGRATMC